LDLIRRKFKYPQKGGFMDKKGVTLIELLIVIAIIGILAVIAVPAYIGQQRNAERTEAYSNLQNLRLLEEQYYAENSCYYREGNPLTCTNKNIPNVASIQAFLPGFKPGSSLSFSYSITTTTVTGGGPASCFTATATGIAGTRVCKTPANCDIFTIDCNNNRNF
jgi:prepilin-type N-terminal cleavage/methylation domain-containing protein